MRRLLFWIIWHIPLGILAPWVLGLAIGRVPMEVRDGRL